MAADRLSRCPSCGAAGTLYGTLPTGTSLGFEAPLDFDIYHCPNDHYWRVWDDGRIEPLPPRPDANS